MDASELTLGQFYAQRFKHLYLLDVRPRTLEEYRWTLHLWTRLTRDPRLDDCTIDDLAAFKAALLTRPGRRSATVSGRTVNKHLTNIHAILAKAGPAGPRNRDALEIIRRSPWIKPAKQLHQLRQRMTLADFDAILRQVETAKYPTHPNIDRAQWWERCLAFAYLTATRRGALMCLAWAHVDVHAATLTIPAAFDKCGREREKPLHDILRRLCLKADRRGPLLPWAHSTRSFDRQWAAFQIAAFGNFRFSFHDIKRLALTELSAVANEWAVRYIGDHAQRDVTGRHYVNPLPQLHQALKQLPLPTVWQQQRSLFAVR